MSRFYKIVISDAASGEILVPNYGGKPGFTRLPSSSNLATYTSLKTGHSVTSLGGTNMAAQMVEVDIPIQALHYPAANSYVRVYGISLAEIAQASNLNGLNCAIYGGFAKGLPLANPLQAGPLAFGTILQAFGNWLGTSQTLDIYLMASGSSPSSNVTTGVPATNTTLPVASTNQNPANLVFQWQQGQPLLVPLVQTLQIAFPKYAIKGAVSPNLVWQGATKTGIFSNLNAFAQAINTMSLNLLGGYAPNLQVYSGVSITLQENTIVISDGTQSTTPKPINFNDLIGQPTWGQPAHVQATCAMRGDIKVGDSVTLPPVLGAITAASNSQYPTIPTPQVGDQYSVLKRSSIFTSTFQVKSLRHVGNSRQPTATSWVTVFELLQASNTASTISDYPTLYSPSTSAAYYAPGVTQ